MQIPKELLESRDDFIRDMWRKVAYSSEIRVKDAIAATHVYLSVVYMYPSDYTPEEDKQVNAVMDALREIQSQQDTKERERDNS